MKLNYKKFFDKLLFSIITLTLFLSMSFIFITFLNCSNNSNVKIQQKSDSINSLLKHNNLLQQKYDSINMYVIGIKNDSIIFLNQKIIELEKNFKQQKINNLIEIENKALKEENSNLKRVINHQNMMIKKLKTK